MGQQSSALRFLACDDWARYVFNSCKLHSKCSDCCEFDVETLEVEVASHSESEDANTHCCF